MSARASQEQTGDPLATSIASLDQSLSPESIGDSSTNQADVNTSPPTSPHKRRRHARPLVENAGASLSQDDLGSSIRLPGNERARGSKRTSRLTDHEVNADHTASMETLEDVGRLVSSAHAPSVAAIYRQATNGGSPRGYEYIPLACFSPPVDILDMKQTPKRFTLNVPTASKSSKHRHKAKNEIDRGKRSKDGSATSDSTLLTSSSQVQRSSRYGSSTASAALTERGKSFGHCHLDFGRIPVEVFELIAQHLAFADVKSMRLVSKQFERGVSGHLFENVVVPFNIDIYGALGTSYAYGNDKSVNCKGKGKAGVVPPNVDSQRQLTLNQQKQNLDVFRGFGPHIRRFGISFEATEEEVSLALPKEIHQGHDAYWGPFRWPFPEYPRFLDRAGLEVTADETPTMKEALHHLRKVTHLALSIDSGLGWLPGPDLSMRSKFLKEPTHPFGDFKRAPEPGLEKRRNLWIAIQDAYERAGNIPALKTAELVRYEKRMVTRMIQPKHMRNAVRLGGGVIHGAPKDTPKNDQAPMKSASNVELLLQETEPRLPSSIVSTISNLTRRSLGGTRLRDTALLAMNPLRGSLNTTQLQSNPEAGNTSDLISGVASPSESGTAGAQIRSVPPPDEISDEPQCGILYTRPISTEGDSDKSKPDKFHPNQLNQSQREWLMETSWAQDAFLSSYIVSIADNADSLWSVATLTLAPLSSCHLTKLFREDFWNSLPSLKCLELMIIPDWRVIERHPAGYTSAPTILPTKALDALYILVENTIAPRKSITELTLGWICGGEHAEGLHARNRLLMPAPLTDRMSALLPEDFGLPVLSLPHVEHLKLVNVWITPNVLQDWTRRHLSHSLKKLSLESVSLTAHPRNTNHGGGGGGAAAAPAGNGGQPAGGNLFNQMMQQFQQQLQQTPPNLALLPAQTQQQWNQMTPAQLAQQLFLASPANGQNVAAGNPNGGLAALALAIPQPQPQVQQQSQTPVQRDGSWPVVLSRLQNLVTLFKRDLVVHFESCGHVILPRPNFDQTVIEMALSRTAHGDDILSRPAQGWFTQRRARIDEQLIQTNDSMLGKIAVALPPEEMQILEDTWQLQPGWPWAALLGDSYVYEDGWGKWGWRNKEAAEYDGEPKGGSGRFSGEVVLAPQDEDNE